MNNHVELSKRAQRDLRKIGRGPIGDQVVAAMRVNLRANPMPENADVKALQGAAPWLRLRSGDYRIIYRPLTAAELKNVGAAKGRPGYLVERLVDRRDLDKAIAQL